MESKNFMRHPQYGDRVEFKPIGNIELNFTSLEVNNGDGSILAPGGQYSINVEQVLELSAFGAVEHFIPVCMSVIPLEGMTIRPLITVRSDSFHQEFRLQSTEGKFSFFLPLRDLPEVTDMDYTPEELRRAIQNQWIRFDSHRFSLTLTMSGGSQEDLAQAFSAP